MLNVLPRISRHLLVILATLWLTLAYMGPLLSALHNYQVSWPATIGFMVVIGCVYAITLFVADMFYSLKAAIFVLFITSALVTYWMNQYGVIVNPDMVTNALETDINEVRNLVSFELVAFTIFLGLVPATLLIHLPLKPQTWLRATRINLGASICLLVTAITIMMVQYSEYSSLFRNHRDVKYRVVPFNIISASVSVATDKLSTPDSFTTIGEDAMQQPDQDKTPKVMVIIVGETARADHFTTNAYPRPTTTALNRLMEQGQLISFENATSCGTSTAISVPCMFSFYQANNYTSTARSTSNVLDVLKNADVDVIWIENNSGCKNVCNRIRTITADAYCAQQAECYDTHMLSPLKRLLVDIKNDTVIVLHAMGSHGPAYYKRSPVKDKKFLPECTTSELHQCSLAAITNAYDNSLVVADQLISQAIELLSRSNQLDASLIYVADHGESLGENGIYLHGLPNWMAPEEQRHIAWLTWPASTWTIDPAKAARYPVTHDYLAHSLLGFFDITTSLYQPQLDLAQQLKKGNYENEDNVLKQKLGAEGGT